MTLRGRGWGWCRTWTKSLGGEDQVNSPHLAVIHCHSRLWENACNIKEDLEFLLAVRWHRASELREWIGEELKWIGDKEHDAGSLQYIAERALYVIIDIVRDTTIQTLKGHVNTPLTKTPWTHCVFYSLLCLILLCFSHCVFINTVARLNTLHDKKFPMFLASQLRRFAQNPAPINFINFYWVNWVRPIKLKSSKLLVTFCACSTTL